MTSIIFDGVKEGNFSVLSFLKRRIKRIVPPLIIVIAVTVAIGYMVMEPVAYQMAGKHGMFSLLFLSNIIYKNESSYFDANSIDKVFLHTWSLSVEWQFYILYPIVVYFLLKAITPSKVKIALLACMVLSFIMSNYASNNLQTSAYYMLYSRSWEMLAGAAVYFYKITGTSKLGRFYEPLGLLIILLSCILYTDATPWPGVYALAPVFGACIVLQSQRNDGILSIKPLQIIGAWSYSLYLVHWPLLSIANNIGYTFNAFFYTAITVSLGAISYIIVEKNLKYWVAYTPFYFATIYACQIISVDGLSSRITNTALKVSPAEFRYRNEGHLGLPSTKEVQFFNAKDGFDFIVIGDSHARHFYSYFKNSGLRVASLAVDGCSSYHDFYSKINYSQRVNNICMDRYNETLSFIKRNPGKIIVWSAAWSNLGSLSRRDTNNDGNFSLTEQLQIFINDASPNYQKLVLIGQTPTTKKNAIQCLLSRSLPINRIFNKCDEYEAEEDIYENKILNDFASKNHKTVYIDPNPAICKNGECKVIDNEKPVYTDNSHLTRKYSNIVGEYIFSKIK